MPEVVPEGQEAKFTNMGFTESDPAGAEVDKPGIPLTRENFVAIGTPVLKSVDPDGLSAAARDFMQAHGLEYGGPDVKIVVDGVTYMMDVTIADFGTSETPENIKAAQE
jgi:hypothetical protein